MPATKLVTLFHVVLYWPPEPRVMEAWPLFWLQNE